ncbi:MAG: N-acetyltransferase family protein [Hyphomicrobiaceae bacterium]
MSQNHPLRPFLPADVIRLQDLVAQSIEELTQDDYDEDQRLAWMSRVADAQAFAQRLAKNVTLVVERDGEILGFASLKDNKEVDLLYVHPYAAGEGVGGTLLDALERLATARGTEAVTADVSDTAYDFFEGRGYTPVQRNNIPIDEVWLANTTMTKALKSKSGEAP